MSEAMRTVKAKETSKAMETVKAAETMKAKATMARDLRPRMKMCMSSRPPS